MITRKGIIHGVTIQLTEATGLRDGQEVEVSIVSIEQPAHHGEVFTIRGGDQVIDSLDTWYLHAPPKKRQKHWRVGRSAMELARNWLVEAHAQLPKRISRLLDGDQATRSFVPRIGYAEFVTRLDTFTGEHRNHDLVVLGESHAGSTLLAVEAKADESFGNNFVGPYFDARSQVLGSRVPDRIKNLSEILFGQPYTPIEMRHTIGTIRYQLLTAAAGTAIEAQRRNAVQAVLLIQEFRSIPELARGIVGTDPRRVRANFTDLLEFLRCLGLKEENLPPASEDFLCGPFLLPGGGIVPEAFPLFVGKTSTLINGDSHANE